MANSGVHCSESVIERAAYQEALNNASDARNSILNFLPVLDQPLKGALELFREKLKERLDWVRQSSLSKRQADLVRQAIGRGDWMRASLLAYEAVITRQCERLKLNPMDRGHREEARQALGSPSPDAAPSVRARPVPESKRMARQMLSALRNTIAHGNPPTTLEGAVRKQVERTLASPEQLEKEILRNLDIMMK